jgi:hypothetical protein
MCGFQCSSECVPPAGECTSDADCCDPETKCQPDGEGGQFCGGYIPP